MAQFNAEHANRLAHAHGPGEFSPGDGFFRWWNHMIVFPYAETCRPHREPGLVPDCHWRGYSNFFEHCLAASAGTGLWQDVEHRNSKAFSSPGGRPDGSPVRLGHQEPANGIGQRGGCSPACSQTAGCICILAAVIALGHFEKRVTEIDPTRRDNASGFAARAVAPAKRRDGVSRHPN